MVRRLWHTSLLVGALLLTLLVAGLGWLLTTRSGAGWLLSRLGQIEGVTLRAEVDGSLWGGLELSGVELRWPGGRLTGDRLEWSWRPRALLGRRLIVEQLAAGRLRLITESAPRGAAAPAGKGIAWPQLPDWLPGVGAEVAGLSVDELAFGPAGAETLVLKELRGRLQLAQGRLLGEDLHVLLPCGSWDGAVSADLVQRKLATDLLWRGEVFAADWNGVRSRVLFDADLSGPLQIALLNGEQARVELQAAARLDAAGVELTAVEIRRPGGPVRASGKLQVAWLPSFLLSGDLQLDRLDLQDLAGWPTDLSGRLVASLDSHGYRGDVDLLSRRPGLEQGALRGRVEGSWHGLELQVQRGVWLEGELSGALQLAWREEFRLRGELAVRGLDPAPLVPELSARLNLRASGGLQVVDGVLDADWDVRLDDSRLQGRSLVGAVAGRWHGNDLLLERLSLSGDGLQLQGSGGLSRGFDLQLQVADLARIGRGWQGSVAAHGRLGRSGGSWFGELGATTSGLQFRSTHATSGELQARLDGDGRLDLELQLQELASDYGEFSSVLVRGEGVLAEHRLQLAASGPATQLSLSLTGGWEGALWGGELGVLHLELPKLGTWDQVAGAALRLGAEELAIEDLVLVGAGGGRLQASAAGGLSSGQSFSIQGAWSEVPLALLTPWLGELQLDGTSSGECRLVSAGSDDLQLQAELSADSRWQWQDQRLELRPVRLQLAWDREGLQLDGRAEIAGGGELKVAARSAEPGHRGWPATGSWQIEWAEVPLGLLNPWLPTGFRLAGQGLGSLTGEWRGNAPPQLHGYSGLDQGVVSWHGKDGLLRVELRQAEASFDWDQRGLRGALSLQLADQGEVRANGEIARPASWPPRLAGQDRITASLDYRLDELGMLAVLLPGVVDESKGALQGRLQLGGRLQQPRLNGEFSLTGAAAELPTAGLRLEDIALAGRLEDQQVTLQMLQLRSGDGLLKGHGELRLDGWKPAAWSLELDGEQLLLSNLAEFRLIADPQLQLSGTPGQYRVRGRVAVTELLLNELPRTGQVGTSEDVRVVGREPAAPLFQSKNLDLELLISLGRKVVVKARGLDARLAGEVTLLNNARSSFAGRGEIRVEEGHYAAYGIKLPIEHGRAVFAGGPVTDPSLDVLAQRTIGEIGGSERVPSATLATPNLDVPGQRGSDVVKAGVRVTGTPRRPVVSLVSDPSLPETDILSYIVLGRPLAPQGESSGESNSGLVLAASALLSQGDSALLQQKLKNQLGIDTIEVQSGTNQGVEDSVITVGKYLTPELYLSYGKALFTPNNYAQLRYRFSPNWELETQLGTVSGADLFYRIEFR